MNHVTLYDWDGARVNVSSCDITGRVIEPFVHTKEPTPAEDFCAYDVEELRQFLRLALVASPPVSLQPATGPPRRDPPGSAIVDTHLQVPTRFHAPVKGGLIWHDAPRWRVRGSEGALTLRPA